MRRFTLRLLQRKRMLISPAFLDGVQIQQSFLILRMLIFPNRNKLQTFLSNPIILYQSMLDLKQLIIARIRQAQQLPSDVESLRISPLAAATIEAELSINRAVLRAISTVRVCQKQRIRNQQEALEQIKSLRFFNAKTVEDVYVITADILKFYQPSFPLPQSSLAAPDHLKALYITFFEVCTPKSNAKSIIKVISNHITESTPFVLLGWVTEWSRSLLSQSIQNLIANEFHKHEQQMKRLNNIIRSSCISSSKQKQVNPFSYSASLPRPQPLAPTFSNKESVFGLFLDELVMCYKNLPLDLDFGFLKSMRKLHSKGNEFETEENLSKAAEILIESKNKHIKEIMLSFQEQCGEYRSRCPHGLDKPKASEKKQKKKAYSKQGRHQSKPAVIQRFFQRVKSQGKQENMVQQTQKRNSLLLCPKTNQISFDSSKEIMRKLRKQRESKEFELPEIGSSNRIILNDRIRSSAIKNKQMPSMFTPINRSMISHYDRGVLKNIAPSPKNIEFKPHSGSRSPQRQEYSRYHRQQPREDPQSKLEGEQLYRNRKLMLQLLREKNKHAFLDK